MPDFGITAESITVFKKLFKLKPFKTPGPHGSHPYTSRKASNYYPISLTSQIIKILKSIVCDNIHKFISEHNLIYPHQHGFISRKSCLMNLLKSFQDYIHYLMVALV